MTVLLFLSEVEEAILSFNEFQNVFIVHRFNLSIEKQSLLVMSIKYPIGSTDTVLALIRKEHSNMILCIFNI